MTSADCDADQDEAKRLGDELDAFSYSVSHDLRAPLRAINSFTRLVLERHGDAMPAEACEMLGVVAENAVHMGRLIDGLLQFSRLSRHPLRREPVCALALVQEVVEHLRSRTSGRAVEVQLHRMPPSYADPFLVRQVFVHLLDNALKLTAASPRARVEIGGAVNDGEPVYFVRDNGVGFDPRYARKLFGIFQRLHRADEFEGTGLGLAIVQRIVRRHGGRIWAESELGQGATFHFNLGKESLDEGADDAAAPGGRQRHPSAADDGRVPTVAGVRLDPRRA